MNDWNEIDETRDSFVSYLQNSQKIIETLAARQRVHFARIEALEKKQKEGVLRQFGIIVALLLLSVAFLASGCSDECIPEEMECRGSVRYFCDAEGDWFEADDCDDVEGLNGVFDTFVCCEFETDLSVCTTERNCNGSQARR